MAYTAGTKRLGLLSSFRFLKICDHGMRRQTNYLRQSFIHLYREKLLGEGLFCPGDMNHYPTFSNHISKALTIEDFMTWMIRTNISIEGVISYMHNCIEYGQGIVHVYERCPGSTMLLGPVLPVKVERVSSHAHTIHFDGSFNPVSGHAGCGVAIFEPNGTLIEYTGRNLKGVVGSSFEAELAGASLALRLAKKMYISRVELVGDNHSFIQMLRGTCHCNDYGEIFDHIFRDISTLDYFRPRHQFREGNRVADYVANCFSYMGHEDVAERELAKICHEDATVLYYRIIVDPHKCPLHPNYIKKVLPPSPIPSLAQPPRTLGSHPPQPQPGTPSPSKINPNQSSHFISRPYEFSLGNQANPAAVVDFGESGPVQYSCCKDYINPFMNSIDQGRRFICSLFGFTDETPRDCHCNLGADDRRRDADERPKLCRDTVEFAATKEYMASNFQTARKRKQPVLSSGPANSSGTANIDGPSPSSAPSTPSTQTPGDVMSMPMLPHSSSSRPLTIFGADANGTLIILPSNQLADMDHFVEDGSLDDTDGRDPVSCMDVSKGAGT